MHNGFINQYYGDGLMALFSSSVDDAVLAALGMLEGLERFNQKRTPLPPLRIGIGLNTGPLLLGTIGGMQRLSANVVSDAVNLASRIEGMTKMYGATILLSESTVPKLRNPERFEIRFLDRVIAIGRTDPVSIFEVCAADPEPVRSQKRQSNAVFSSGLSAYSRGDFTAARESFEQSLAICGDDLAARLYVDRCSKMKLDSGVAWNGITTLTGK